MSPEQLENTLKDLPRIGTLIRRKSNRQIWRFEFEGVGYYLKFYPRATGRLKRLMRGNPALKEFFNLQVLQRMQIPSPRAVAVLQGFQLNDQKGDAVISEAIEPAVPLDQYLNELDFRGQLNEERRQIGLQVRELVLKLGKARLSHADLHLGNILLCRNRLFLVDAYALKRGGLKTRDTMLLALSANRFANRSDLLRAWKALSNAKLPIKNFAGPARFRKFVSQTLGTNERYVRISEGKWRGHAFLQFKFPRRWSVASQIRINPAELQSIWASLIRQINSDSFPILKRSPSGDVMEAQIAIGERTVPVVIKRPKRKSLFRKLTQIGRSSRALRIWIKAWKLIIRDFEAEFPLFVMEKSTLGYVTDSVIVVEKVGGDLLSRIDLNSMSDFDRQNLFHRLGRIIRLLERAGFTHFDSKTTNWIIRRDEHRGPVPVMIDVDGIRHYRWRGFAMARLIRSLREHPMFRAEDERNLTNGYSPWTVNR